MNKEYEIENETETLDEQDLTIKDQYLTFDTDNDVYGIPIENIKEIVGVPDITKVPNTDDYVKGIINLRGDVVVVIDVRIRFGKPEIEYDELTCIIVIEYNNSVLGLIVDNVSEVLYIEKEQVMSPPKAKLKYPNEFIKNIGKVDEDVKLLLDLEKLLNEQDL